MKLYIILKQFIELDRIFKNNLNRLKKHNINKSLYLNQFKRNTLTIVNCFIFNFMAKAFFLNIFLPFGPPYRCCRIVFCTCWFDVYFVYYFFAQQLFTHYTLSLEENYNYYYCGCLLYNAIQYNQTHSRNSSKQTKSKHECTANNV